MGATAGAAALGSLSACTATRPAAVGRALPASVDDLERRTFAYFWDTTPADTGLAPDGWPGTHDCSIASVGFALTAVPIGVERGFVTRAQAAQRVLNTLRFFRALPQGPQMSGTAGYQGFFYHSLDARTGLRVGESELSTVDTALLMLGVLYCREWFDRDSPAEIEIRALADALYAAVDWEWARRGAAGITFAWHPDKGHDPVSWPGYNEGMLLYLIALGSPTHPVPESAWAEWTRTYDTLFGGFGGEWGPAHLQFAPHFGHQYTQVWFDLRGVQDDYMRAKGIDYFENSRRATLAQRGYAIANPNDWKDYGADIWGLTACHGPGDFTLPYRGRQREFKAYLARGAGGTPVRDDGTLAPTAAAASIAFAPEIVVPAIEAMRRRYGDHVYGRYGFVDGFNPSFDFDVSLARGRRVPGLGWFDTGYVGIDQGPILAMIANHRSEAVWAPMRRAAWLRRGLKRAGFRGGWLERDA